MVHIEHGVHMVCTYEHILDILELSRQAIRSSNFVRVCVPVCCDNTATTTGILKLHLRSSVKHTMTHVDPVRICCNAGEALSSIAMSRRNVVSSHSHLLPIGPLPTNQRVFPFFYFEKGESVRNCRLSMTVQ